MNAGGQPSWRKRSWLEELELLNSGEAIFTGGGNPKPSSPPAKALLAGERERKWQPNFWRIL